MSEPPSLTVTVTHLNLDLQRLGLGERQQAFHFHTEISDNCGVGGGDRAAIVLGDQDLQDLNYLAKQSQKLVINLLLLQPTFINLLLVHLDLSDEVGHLVPQSLDVRVEDRAGEAGVEGRLHQAEQGQTFFIQNILQ